ncbi:hypothetical protein CLU79DRAFT_727379 [Phycomyces nitens]|nr:hypothetical protein CLU79DRAFT_727379 [Phycomyces nitens]
MMNLNLPQTVWFVILICVSEPPLLPLSFSFIIPKIIMPFSSTTPNQPKSPTSQPPVRRSTSALPRKLRRRSWFQNSLFSLFASAPPSPVHEVSCQKQRSHSLDPQAAYHKPVRSPTLNLGKSTIQSFLSKAKRTNTKRSPTQINDSSVLDEPQDYFSINPVDPIGGDGARRSNSQLVLTENIIASVHPLQPQKPPHRYQHQKHASEPNHFLKSDDDEVDRIQLKNDLVKLAFEGEFKFPFRFQDLKNGRVLDVGCGPGSWCIDIARKYPSVQVIGVDSEDMFPDPVTVPENCQLVRYNVLDGLSGFEDCSLDFVHIRFMALSFTADQYSRVIKDCWRILRPGGYLEMMEADITIYSPGPVTAKINKEVATVANDRGFKPWLARQLAELVPQDALDRQERYRSLPLGLWGGRLGVMFRDDMIHVLTKCKSSIRDYYNQPFEPESQKAFELELAEISREMEQYHSYSNFHFITVQKPEAIVVSNDTLNHNNHNPLIKQTNMR